MCHIDKGTMCHESGHAIGLVHGKDSYPQKSNGFDGLHCMQSPRDEITDSRIGRHNRDQVNNTY